MRSIKRGGTPTDILEDSSTSHTDTIQKIQGDISNEIFVHIWSDMENDGVKWNGVATKYEKTKNEVVIDYWTIDSERDNADSYGVNVYQLASDYYKGELLFIKCVGVWPLSLTKKDFPFAPEL